MFAQVPAVFYTVSRGLRKWSRTGKKTVWLGEGNYGPARKKGWGKRKVTEEKENLTQHGCIHVIYI
jgi:hypothetical protein